MLFKTILPGLVAVALVSGVTAGPSPQVTTVLPFMVADNSGIDDGSDGSEVISGIIVGTGAAGETTYVISQGGTGSGDVPVTATLIEGASGATAIVAFTDDVDGSVVTQTVACGFQDGNADCTVAVVGVVDSFTTTVLGSSIGPADSVTLVVSTSAASSAAGSATTASAAPGSAQSSGLGRNTITSTFAVALSLVFVTVALV